MTTTPALRTDPALRSATDEATRIGEGEHARTFRAMDIADPEDHLYWLYGLEKSWKRFAMSFINLRITAKSCRDASIAGFGKGF